MHDVLALVRPQAESRGQRLQATLPDEPMPLIADSTRLEQIVGNLLSNALKYTQTDGTIDVELKRSGSQFVLRIQDNGVGMTPAMPLSD